MDFAIVRLKKQTVIPRRDKKESQSETNCKHSSVQVKLVGVPCELLTQYSCQKLSLQ